MLFKQNLLAVTFLVVTMAVASAAGGRGGGAGGAGGASGSSGTSGTGTGGPGVTNPGPAATSPQMTPGSAANPRPGCTGGSSAMTGNGQSNTQTHLRQCDLLRY
jgi:hypothetical protein